ncbi:MAG: Hpt domain-containing protein, partial [Gammaproteobacteria bacterium]|nr:Hpt domain-containing protein [Gammaproteobacteria bacterium]
MTRDNSRSDIIISEKRTSLNKKIQTLKKKFHQSLLTTLDSISNIAQQLKSIEQWEAQDLAELHRHFHNLSGSAKIFDAERVSLVAQKSTNLIQDYIANAPVVDNENKATVYELIAALEHAIKSESEIQTAVTQPDAELLSSHFKADGYVFIVEEDIQQGNVFKLKLEDAGFKVKYFSNLDTFRQACTKEIPIAIVIDTT